MRGAVCADGYGGLALEPQQDVVLQRGPLHHPRRGRPLVPLLPILLPLPDVSRRHRGFGRQSRFLSLSLARHCLGCEAGQTYATREQNR